MNERVRQTWPELHGEHLDVAVVRPLVDRELGVQHLREPAQLEDLLGWRGLAPVVPATEFWTTSVVARAVINLRRRADAPAPAAPAPTTEASSGPAPTAPAPTASMGASGPASSEPTGLAFGAWLRAAMSYLPRPLPRSLPAAGEAVEPIEVAAATSAG